MPVYDPPVLNRKIRVRNPGDEPDVDRDTLGRVVGDLPKWGEEVWANRRDQAPFTIVGEGAQIRAGRSVFTIRYTDGIAPNAQVIDEDGTPFNLTGVPSERGGVNGEMLERYLELHCERLTAEETQ